MRGEKVRRTVHRSSRKRNSMANSTTISRSDNKKENKKNHFVKYLKYAIIGLVTGAANGLFGSGGGTIAVPAMVHLLGADEHKAHATAISIILPLTVVSSIFYITKGYADWGLTLKVMAGGIAGGYIGARLLNICPDNILRKVFAAFMAAAGIKMLRG